MKSKLKSLTTTIAVATLIGCGLFASCDKEDTTTKQEGASTAKGDIEIPVFNSYEEVEEIIAKATSFDTITDLDNYEKTQSRNSIGKISDMFYEKIDLENFSDPKEVVELYIKNKNVLDTFMEDGEIIISPKLNNTPYRYVANLNGMFAINDTYYKLVKNGIYVTTKDHLYELLDTVPKLAANPDTGTIKYFPFIINATKLEDCNNCVSIWDQ